MKRLAITGIFALLALFAAPASKVGAQQLLFDYVGFDYESPNPDTSQFGEAGTGYNGLGEVQAVFSPLTWDPANNQYTYYITGLTQSNRQTFGTFIVIDYTGPGTLTIYEDSKTLGTPAIYGVDPPNGTAPSSFIDGNPILVGNLTNFRFVINTAQNSGSFEADFEVVGGSQLGNFPTNQRKGWTFAGSTGNATSIAHGYEHQIDGQVFLNEPVPVRSMSLGRIKGLYR